MIRNVISLMAKSSESPTVFIVDDDPAIRSSLARALQLRGFRVQTYESAIRFLDQFDGNAFGCLILDQGLPGMTGLELQKHLNERRSNLPIIFITGHGGVPESVQAIKNGAADFLEKPFRQSDLIERIHDAIKGAEAAVHAERENRDARRRFERLTPRESEVVEYMLANPSEVSSKGIARALEISPRTVDHHRARIFEKLEIGSVAELIDLARRLDEPLLASRTA